MSESATEWAWRQRAKDGSPLAANLRLALLALARETVGGGSFTLRRKEIASLLECSLDTVDRRISKLEGEGLLKVERIPRKNGYGPSKYTLAMPAAGRNIAATSGTAASRKGAALGQRNPAGRDNAELRLGEAAKVAATGAASIRVSSETVESLGPEFYPERVELAEEAVVAREAPHVLNGSAAGMPTHELARIIVEHVNSRWLDPEKTSNLNTTHARIRAWMVAGADFDLDILPTIKTVMARQRSASVDLWGYFDKPIRAAVAKRLAAEAPMLPITPAEATHDDASRASEPATRYVPRKRDRVFDAIYRDESRDAPDDFGRVDFNAGK